MADPLITPEQAQIAKVAASGAFGGAVLVFLRHPGSVMRVVLMIGMGIGFATIFATDMTFAAPFVGEVKLKAVQVAALWGLLGKTAADAMVRAAEKKLDFSAWFGRKAG